MGTLLLPVALRKTLFSPLSSWAGGELRTFLQSLVHEAEWEEGSSLVLFQPRWPFHSHPTALWCFPSLLQPFASIRGQGHSYWAVFLYPKREQPWNFKTSPLPSVLSLQSPPGNVSTFKAVPFTQEQSIYCLHVSSLPSSLISLTDLWNQCGLNETYHLLWSIISDSALIPQCYICWSAGGEQRRYFETLGKECNWLMERRVKWWTHSIRHLIMRHRWQNMYLLFGIYEFFIKN